MNNFLLNLINYSTKKLAIFCKVNQNERTQLINKNFGKLVFSSTIRQNAYMILAMLNSSMSSSNPHFPLETTSRVFELSS